MTTVYLIDLKYPHRVIREVDCTIVQRKFTWAEDANGGRHLVSASAFYTYASACRAKFGALMKVTSSAYIRSNVMLRSTWRAANDELMQNPDLKFKVIQKLA